MAVSEPLYAAAAFSHFIANSHTNFVGAMNNNNNREKFDQVLPKD